MTTCKECLHVEVCGRYAATGGHVRECKHFVTDNNVGGKWISVEDRLPDKDGKFLVHRIICGGVSTMSVVGFARNGRKVHAYDLRKKKNVWYEYDSEVGYYSLHSVTHWMPLPEPPKEDKE